MTAWLDARGAEAESGAGAVGGYSHRVDLLDVAATMSAVEASAKAMGGIDGVVNCAGLGSGAPLENLDIEIWSKMIGVNLTAPYVICRAALPWLRKRHGATIVNIASAQALLPNAPGAAAYAASKGGLTTFTKALAAELAPHIRANVVCPGIVDTPMTRSILERYQDPNSAPFIAQYAMKRVARPEEIATAVLYLTSDESSYVTGIAMAVDGGRTFH